MSVKSSVNSDFNYPQFGRLHFDASFVSDQVPELLMMEIRQKGKFVSSRTVAEIFKTTRIGFNSNALKNGLYEISFKHRTFGKLVEGPSFKVTIKND